MRLVVILMFVLSLSVPPWKIEVAVQAGLAASQQKPPIKAITPAETPIRK